MASVTAERHLTRCRVTVNMVGARANEEVLVDLASPAMGELVDAGYLVPLEAPPASAEQPVETAPAEPQEPPGADETPEAAESAVEPPAAS